MVRTLAACGADVAVHYHSQEEMARQLVDEVRAMGRRAVAVQADVGCEHSVLAMRDRIRDELGMPQIVVCNAVSGSDWKSVIDQPVEDYESQFDSCVLHCVLMAKAFVPAMKEAGYGRFIGINTECAMQCFPHQSAYAAAKRGMDGVLRVLAREVGPYNITVNQVAPGWIFCDTDRGEAGPREDAHYTAHVPLRRRGTDEDIASAVAFLASDLARFISGVYLPVAGGNVMPCI